MAAGAKNTVHHHFYMHDDYSSATPTAAKVVSGPTTAGGSQGPRSFGDVVVLNNLLTADPDPASKAVGRAQGFAARVSECGVVSELVMTVMLEEEGGEHQGSTVTVLGRIDPSLPVRELAIVGGTGQFRLARGYAFTKSYDYNLATGGAVEMDLHVVLD